MPLYEYQCDACGQRFEVIQKFSDAAPEACEACGKGPVRRLLSSPAIQFKGSGFYITDYAQKGRSDGAGAGAKGDTGDAKAGTKSESGTGTKTETKSETKGESRSESKNDAKT